MEATSPPHNTWRLPLQPLDLLKFPAQTANSLITPVISVSHPAANSQEEPSMRLVLLRLLTAPPLKIAPPHTQLSVTTTLVASPTPSPPTPQTLFTFDGTHFVPVTSTPSPPSDKPLPEPVSAYTLFLVLFLTLFLRHTLPITSLTFRLGTAILDILILILILLSPWHAPKQSKVCPLIFLLPLPNVTRVSLGNRLARLFLKCGRGYGPVGL